MFDWADLTSALVGGLLAIGASIGAVEVARRRQAGQWRQELFVKVVSDALVAMQRYMREILSLAYSTNPPYHRELVDGVEQVFPKRPRETAQEELFDDVISEWNGAMHRLLATAPAEIVALSREIDAELDRLLDLAIDHQWSREAFREERVAVGRLAAQFVDAARQETNARRLSIDNVWTWADQSEADSVSTAASSE